MFAVYQTTYIRVWAIEQKEYCIVFVLVTKYMMR